MAAYPPAVGGAPGGMPGFSPGMMPPYPMQRPPLATQAPPRGPLFPSATASVGNSSQLRQVRARTNVRLARGVRWCKVILLWDCGKLQLEMGSPN